MDNSKFDVLNPYSDTEKGQMFLNGKKKKLLSSLQKEMKGAAQKLDFEKANLIKNNIKKNGYPERKKKEKETV
jgi:excinuclease UvrABC nuclease subunit